MATQVSGERMTDLASGRQGPYQITPTPGGGDGGLLRIVVELGAALSAAARDELLTDGVVALVEQLAQAAAGPPERPVAVDVRIPAASPSALECEAFVEAARGLVQSLVLERGKSIGPVNVVISHPAQEQDRAATWAYLAAGTGSFSRGATYDLREVAI
jgi:hypothetical protein